MTTTLIVLAHPEKSSFNGSWAKATRDASLALGHEVICSDLYSMKFDPVESLSHYPEFDEEPFDVLKAQETASDANNLPGDVTSEISKIHLTDRVIFHFPIWWFSLPAILKGWCDRVLAHGSMHSVDNRFDQGLFRGKRALFCVTTGSRSSESAFNGKEGDVQMLLWPFAYTLRYLGFTILEPRVIHGVHGYHVGQAKAALQLRLQDEINAHSDTIAGFDMLPAIPFNADSDFDKTGQLRPGVARHSYFIRHKPSHDEQ
jgi:NAD(P)H dehydrogenase (quinone)